MAPRPVFNATIGAFFRQLREGRGLQLRQAALIAAQRQIPALSPSKLSNLETGKVKNVKPEVLQSLAALYEMDYADLASRYSALKFTQETSPAVPHSRVPRLAPRPLPLKIARAAAALEVMDDRVREPILGLIRETVARLRRQPSPARIAELARGLAPEATSMPPRDPRQRTRPGSSGTGTA